MAAKAQRWPMSRPARGSVGICGSFIETPGPRNRTDLSGVIRFVDTKKVKWHGTRKNRTNMSGSPCQPGERVHAGSVRRLLQLAAQARRQRPQLDGHARPN